MSSYATLGYSCSSQGNALTSNHKYLPPLDPVYKKPFTEMLRYPGQDGYNLSDENNHFLNRDHLVVHFGKNTNPHRESDYIYTHAHPIAIPVDENGRNPRGKDKDKDKSKDH